MRYYPEDEYDWSRVKEDLKPDDWALEALKLNPPYLGWGNYEDYMGSKEGGWDSPQELEGPEELWSLDDLNELVNFYFFLEREGHECADCEGRGFGPEKNRIFKNFYKHMAKPGEHWAYDLTKDEVETLFQYNRVHWEGQRNYRYDLNNVTWTTNLTKKMMKRDGEIIVDKVQGDKWVPCSRPEGLPSVEEVNRRYRESVIGHDSINCSILVEARAKRQGVNNVCENCKGTGKVYDVPKAELRLQMWMIHPRKGCSRGVIVKNIQKDDMPKVLKHLKTAAERNANRFSKAVEAYEKMSNVTA